MKDVAHNFFFFLLNFLYCIEVWTINNFVMVSGGQQRDSAINIHVSPKLFPPRLLQNIEQSSMCYIVDPLLLIHFKYRSMYLSISISIKWGFLDLSPLRAGITEERVPEEAWSQRVWSCQDSISTVDIPMPNNTWFTGTETYYHLASDSGINMKITAITVIDWAATMGQA